MSLNVLYAVTADTSQHDKSKSNGDPTNIFVMSVRECVCQLEMSQLNNEFLNMCEAFCTDVVFQAVNG